MDSQSMSMNRSKLLQARASKSPAERLKLNPWKRSTQNYNEEVYCKNLESYAQSLIMKMKTTNLSKVKSSSQISKKPALKIKEPENETGKSKVNKFSFKRSSKTRR